MFFIYNFHDYRVHSVHQRLEGLVNKLQTDLVPKIRSMGTTDPKLNSAGNALVSPSYRLSSSRYLVTSSLFLFVYPRLHV